MKKFVIMSMARSGSHAVVHSLANAGLNVCLTEPYWMGSRHKTNYPYNHIAYSKDLFMQYDGFKIIFNQTQQLKEICEENNAGLILIRRKSLLHQIASYIKFAHGHGGKDTSTYKGWTSTGAMEFTNDLIDNIPFFTERVDNMIYGNYLIDNVYINYPNYVTTICYEEPEKSNDMLCGYFHRDISINIAPQEPLSSYFTNPDDFISAIKSRTKMLSDCF